MEIDTRGQYKSHIYNLFLHPFGCPVYVLNNRLQASQQLNKWLPRARVGMYLGMSPHHARTVALVLNVETALVSPQFHVKFDDSFNTVSYPRNQSINVSAWKIKAGFGTSRQRAISPTTAMFNDNSQQNTVSLPTTRCLDQPTETPETTTEQTNETPETTAPIPNATRPQRNRRPSERMENS